MWGFFLSAVDSSHLELDPHIGVWWPLATIYLIPLPVLVSCSLSDAKSSHLELDLHIGAW